MADGTHGESRLKSLGLERPQTSAVVPPLRKQERLLTLSLVCYRIERRPTNLRILPQEGLRSMEQDVSIDGLRISSRAEEGIFFLPQRQ